MQQNKISTNQQRRNVGAVLQVQKVLEGFYRPTHGAVLKVNWGGGSGKELGGSTPSNHSAILTLQILS